MNKKEAIIPFAFLALSLLFIAVSLMVYLSKGKSKKWIARKMKIGGLLLTMTAVSCNGGGNVKCYDTAPFNYMSLNNDGEKGIEINTDTSNILQGHISGRHGNDFSFSINDKSGKAILKDIVLPVDIAFDSEYEDFKIYINRNLEEGKYQIKLYASKPESQDTVQPQNEYKLMIKHE